MKVFRNILPLIAFAGLMQTAIAQDIHYSQFYSTPLYINPALTGNHECNIRIGLNYRQQASYLPVPFETYSAFGDTRFSPRFLKNRGWFGIGGNFYYDNAGSGDLKKTQGMLFGAYSQGFNSDNSLYGSLGVGLGLTNRSINYNNFLFDNQWDPDNLLFDPTWSTGESFADNSIFYPEFNMGLALHHIVNDNWMYNIGISMSHINKPTESFFGENNRVGRKLIGHAGVQFLATEKLLIKPEVFFAGHEGVQETVFGANAVYGLLDLKLYGGIWHRLNRDIIPVLGLEYNHWVVLFSYDVNISQQRIASAYEGGLELSLVKKFCERKSTKRDPCKYLEF